MARCSYAALAAACGLFCAVSIARSQEAPTAGGDVTAEEATPLPPVVVQSPALPLAPIARAKAKSQGGGASVSVAGNGSTSASGGPAGGQGSGDGAAEAAIAKPGFGAFTLGQLDMIGGSTITNEAMWTFNKQSLGQAVNLLPGVSWSSTGAPSINSSGARNEGDIFVRGFNRFQVPLSIDGVRIYLPADNRIDMNRFLTQDLAEVQVAKGYVSVLNGPGGEGGAINLVSRKPTKEIELEGRAGIVVDGNMSSLNQWNSYAYAGTRQKGYYAQVSGSITDQDHFNLSDRFVGATSSILGYQSSFPYEQGGDRDRSDFRDWRINTKVGITPNATDEYSLNYTVQQGEKGAPLHTERQIVQGYFNLTGAGQVPRFWDWPQWDVSTLSWLSKTQLGSASYIKTNAFYNTFDNKLSFYPNSQYLFPLVDSPYHDHSSGGFVELGTNLIPMNTLKGAIHYREDVHRKGDIVYDPVTGAFKSQEATQTQSEETWSFALENTLHITRYLDFVTGASYNLNSVLTADGTTTPIRPTVDAWDGQGGLVYNYSDTGATHFTVSSRTRFPTLFERYSTRFGAKLVNPDLAPERATNYELGFSDTFASQVHLASNIFYSDIKDSIQNAFAGANGMASIIGFNADGYNYGFELSADWDIQPGLRLGGNYAYLERNLDFADAALAVQTGAPAPVNAQAAVAASQLEGTPRHHAFIYLAWKPTDRWTLTPNLELAGDRTALVTSCLSTLIVPGGVQNNGGCPVPKGATQATARPNYERIGSYALVNFSAEYAFTPNWTTGFGVTNLLDENYSLADGFPEPGRQFFANMRAKF